MRGLPFPKVCFLSLFIFSTIFITIKAQATETEPLARFNDTVQADHEERLIPLIESQISIFDHHQRTFLNIRNRPASEEAQKGLIIKMNASRQQMTQIKNMACGISSSRACRYATSSLSMMNRKTSTLEAVSQSNPQAQEQNTKTIDANQLRHGMTPEQEEEARRVAREANEEKAQQAAAAACQSSYGAYSQISCNASLFSPAILGLIQVFNNADTEGDIQAACKKAKKHNKLGLLLNTAAYGTCLNGLRLCIKKCNAAAQLGDFTAQEKAGECKSKAAMISIVAIPTMLANARQVFSTKCGPNETNEGNEDNYYCQEKYGKQLEECKKNKPYNECVEIERQLSVCTGGGQQEVACAGMTGEELHTCLELSQVTDPSTGHVPGAPGGRLPEKNPLPLDNISAHQFNPDDLLEGLDENGEEDIPVDPQVYTGNEDVGFQGNNVPLSANGNPGGVGGLGGGGIGGFLGAGAGAGEDQEGEEGPYEEDVDPGIDTEILGDFNNARGGSAGFGGGGQGGAQGFNLKGANLKGFDLPKGLFGDKKGNKAGRSMAGIGGANEITSANGLSNFQKVSRAMNQRRRNEFK